MKKGAKLFITTPPGELRKNVGNNWELSAYDSPHHVQFFTEKSLYICLKKAGFSKLKYRFINELYPNRDYNTIGSKIITLRGYYSLKGYAGHLTYFVS